MGRPEGIIIGGGAAGLMAAITAAENGAGVTILEHMPRVGKKILSTGNGKCNLTNLDMRPDCYRCGTADFPMTAIGRFSVADTVSFFRRLGVVVTDRNGYVYPASGQAQTVLDALREKAESLGIRIVTECRPETVERDGTGFCVRTSCGAFQGDFLILAAGSRRLRPGSDGSGCDLAASLGHNLVNPLPALVTLKCRGDFFRSIAGVRTEAEVSLYTAGKHGELGDLLASDRGELQLTDYGISGIPVFQVSRYASEALDRKKRVLAVLDFFPSLKDEELFSLLKEQRMYLSDRKAEGFLNGIFHKKLAALFLKAAGIRGEEMAGRLSDKKLLAAAELIKRTVVEVTAANSFDKAQVCMGGVRVKDVDPCTMESRLVPGLYFAGEILDVDGICGGYNLQWAWSSGYAAGASATR
ncbi:MAG: NAD(P)/FAD-dependent oxidoreductase [Alitiscatomonas sp.]